jgi:hypothetical protein
MIDTNDITLICPQNDLEGATIINIARQYGIDIRISLQGWGGRLGNEPAENLKNLKKTVMVVELYDPQAEEKLKFDGHNVIIIDHHYYSNAIRWNSKSSLEQFCELIGQPMTEKLWQVAINDTAFITGLFRLGLSFEEMEKVRIEERKLLGTDELFKEALEYVKNNRRRYKDLDILLSPFKFHLVMSEAAQWIDSNTYNKAKGKGRLELPNCLLIYFDDHNHDKIVQIEFFGNQQYGEAFDDILKDKETIPLFEMWRGGSASACYWGAIPKVEISDQIDKIIDKVLSFTLIQGRPLRYFSTSFLFPFRFKLKKPPQFVATECSPDSYSPEETLYFLPHIQKLFYQKSDKKDSGIKRWLLPLDERSKHLELFKADKIQITLPITAIYLYRFFNDIHILEISISQNTDVTLWHNKPLWRALFDPKISTMLTTEDVLIVNNLGRILFSSYSEQGPEKKMPGEVIWHCPGKDKATTFLPKYKRSVAAEGSFSSVILDMIEAFTGSKNKSEIDFEFIYDDRMFVHTCLAFGGDKPSSRIAEEHYHALFTTATYVDQIDWGANNPGGYYYDASFVKELIKPFTNTRWYGPSGNLYGFSRFAAVFMGYGSDFHKFVTKHVNTMYLRQSIMALFYRSSLLYYHHLMANIQYPATQKDEFKTRKCLEQVRKIHWELTLFTNQYWYSELTNQDQGIEIFNLQKKAMELTQEYSDIKEKIDRVYNVLDAKNQSTRDQIIWLAGVFGIAITIINVVCGFAAFSSFQMDVLGEEFNSWFFWVDTILSGLGFLTLFGVLIYALKKLGFWRWLGLRIHGFYRRFIV